MVKGIEEVKLRFFSVMVNNSNNETTGVKG